MKMNKTLIILSLLLVFCISLSAVSATEDISVNDTNDDSVATVESSVMNEEINELSGGPILPSYMIDSYIEMATGTYKINNDYQIYSTWVIFNDKVRIDGQGHTIYGNGKQAFKIYGEGVTIYNLNFVNCSAIGGGGAIFFGGSGNVLDCSFVNCSAIGGGGAIYFEGCDLNSRVIDCSFVNCSADLYDYSAIYDINKVTVKDCSFEKCKGKDNNGSTPLFKPKVILTVDDIKGVSGSTVKVDVSVHDILGRPINEGTVIISLDGKEYTAKVVDGIATFNVIIPSKKGIYSAKVFFNGEGTDYDNTTCDFTVTSVEDINKSVVSNNMENCGTPLIALLIALISLPLIRRK